MAQLRESLRKFSQEMEYKLASKDSEHEGNAWLQDDCTFPLLRARLLDEVLEFEEAVDRGDVRNICEECIDIANFAMMIHSKLQRSSSYIQQNSQD